MSRSTALLVLSALVVAACGATPSPSPGRSAATQSSAPSSPATQRPLITSPATASATPPTSTPLFGGGWPLIAVGEPTFGPDGTVYALAGPLDAQSKDQGRLVAIDAAGRVKPGWPIEEPPGSDFGSFAVGLDGSIYVVECGGPTVGCVLHRLGSDGRELPGWPFEIAASSACLGAEPCVTFLILGSDGTAYVTSWPQTQDQTQIMAIDAAGEMKPGWPVAVTERYGWFSYPQLGSDGTLFVLTHPDGGDSQASLAAFDPDGSLRPGWPVPLPGRYSLGPQGTVVIWWGIDDRGELCTDYRRTNFTVLGPDGMTLPGWPRGSEGSASSPVVAADGTVYYVSARGNVYAHGRSGEVKAGWPVSVPGVFPGCDDDGPSLSPNGTVFVLGDEVVAISPSGNHWSYRPQGALGGTSCDTDSSNKPAPAFSADGTSYISVFDSMATSETIDIVALDREGHVKPGWPYRLSIDGRTSDVGFDVSPDGTLYVATAGCGSDGVATLLALDADGRILD